MSDTMRWTVAEVDRMRLRATAEPFPRREVKTNTSLDRLPAHQFPGRTGSHYKVGAAAQSIHSRRELDGASSVRRPYVPAKCSGVDGVDDVEHQRRIYRGRTVAMLRRYLRYSMETGRLPSLVGREFFRSKVTRYQVTTFEDRVIFVHDMETCLQKLDEYARDVLGRIVLQEYGHEEAARLLGCTRMTVHRRLIDALDWLSSIMLEVGLLEPLLSNIDESCQASGRDSISLSQCSDGK